MRFRKLCEIIFTFATLHCFSTVTYSIYLFINVKYKKFYVNEPTCVS